ncbi:MAG: chemotaxis protein CheA [Halanaerobiales bacterium]
MVDNSLLKTFMEETEENLQIMEEALLELENKEKDKELLDTVFRSMHSIKGGAGLVGLELISDITHKLENILEDLRQEQQQVPEPVFNFLFEGMDIIREMLKTEDFEGEDIPEARELLSALEDYYSGKKNEESKDKKENSNNTGGKFYRVRLKFREDIFENGTDPLMLILELEENGFIVSSKLDPEGLPDIYELDPYKLYLSWEFIIYSRNSLSKIKEIFIFVADDNDIEVKEISKKKVNQLEVDKEKIKLLQEQKIITEIQAEKLLKGDLTLTYIFKKDNKQKNENKGESISRSKKSQRREMKQSRTVRVDAGKLEDILNDIAELLIAQSRVKELTSSCLEKTDRSTRMNINSSFEDVDKIIRRVQEEVMNASMIPIAGTFTRMQRLVRDISREKNKKVNLKIRGKETELDRKIVEQLGDPLKHLIRNAIDHGLETPEEREAKGKPETGTIILEAFHQEGNIFIKVSDDGAGIDKDKVLKRAVDRGLIEKGQKLNESDIYNLLFKPGFSTSDSVSDISGRGVGLDVVKNNINNIRGNVTVESSQDQGTTFTIKLPLTLAIIDGMIIRVGKERFVIPLTSIVEFVDARRQVFKRVEGKGTIINLRDEYIPYLPLYQLFDISLEKVEAVNKKEGLLVILSNGQKKLAVQVDEIIGEEQVVIKSVKENMGQARGFTGATIMGDGNVSLIIDVSSVFEMARNKINFDNGDKFHA